MKITEKNNESIKEYISFRGKWAADAVRERRIKLGISQEAVAKAVGSSRATVARIERGDGYYNQAELEVLSLFLEMDPREMCGLRSFEWGALVTAYSDQYTNGVLGREIKCQIPESLAPSRLMSYNARMNCPFLSFSPDNRKLSGFLYSKDGSDDNPVLCVWDVETGRLEAIITDEKMWGETSSFDPSGRYIAYATSRDTVTVWDWKNQKQAAFFDAVGEGYPEELWTEADESDEGFGIISALAWSPDGKYLTSLNEDHGTLRVWNFLTRSLERTIVLPATIDLLANDEHRFVEDTGFCFFSVRYMGFLENGNLLVIPSLSKKLYIFDPLDRRPSLYIHSFVCEENIEAFARMPLKTTAGASFGQIMAIGGEEGMVEVGYTTDQERRRGCYEDHGLPKTWHQLSFVGKELVGLVEWRTGQKGSIWALENLYSHQIVRLPVFDRINLGGVVISGECKYFATSDEENIQIVKLRMEMLASKNSQSQPWLIEMNETVERIRINHEGATSPEESWEIVETVARNKQKRTALETKGVPGEENLDFQRSIQESNNEIERKVERWKWQQPSSEGGYGLASLDPSDDETAMLAKKKIESETKERIGLVDAATSKKTPVKLRSLIELIVGRDLKNGEFTKDEIEKISTERPYTMLWIDHAELLDESALIWIASHLYEMSDLTILIARDKDKFDDAFSKDPVRAHKDWFFMRSSFIDLEQDILGQQSR